MSRPFWIKHLSQSTIAVSIEMLSERSFDSLIKLIAKLRSPEGCPWDRKQTHTSLLSYLIEECYEAIHAIRSGDSEALKDELGDLLLQVAFHIQLAKEAGHFDEADVLNSIHDKMIHRHPHVFGDLDGDITAVKLRWENLKRDESEKDGKEEAHLPALIAARKLCEKAENLGIGTDQVVKLPDAELERKLREAISSDPDSIGSILLLLADLSRTHGLEPEIELNLSVKNAAERLEKRAAREASIE